jgi:antitoxin component YwqK of YwqJK toxin-antitoxin module
MTSDLARENCFGDYVEYYENGNLQVKGQCAKTDLGEFGTGKWTWYYESGAIEDSATYKLFEEKYSNGKTSLIGSLIYDSKTNEWVRHGKWRSFYENGHGKVDFNYEWGELKKDD